MCTFSDIGIEIVFFKIRCAKTRSLNVVLMKVSFSEKCSTAEGAQLMRKMGLFVLRSLPLLLSAFLNY